MGSSSMWSDVTKIEQGELLGPSRRLEYLLPRVDPYAHDNSGYPAEAGIVLAAASNARAPERGLRTLLSYLEMYVAGRGSELGRSG
jgi:hypothetical protein